MVKIQMQAAIHTYDSGLGNQSKQLLDSDIYTLFFIKISETHYTIVFVHIAPSVL